MQKIENFINGELLPPKSAKYLDNFEPATGKIYNQIPDSDATDVENAVKAAEKATLDSFKKDPTITSDGRLKGYVSALKKELKNTY